VDKCRKFRYTCLICKKKSIKIKAHIAFIGTGKVAKSLIKVLHKDFIITLYGRNLDESSRLANQYSLNLARSINACFEAEVIFLAVSDHAIEACIERCKAFNGQLVHFSGSTPKDVFKQHKRWSVFWPIQSINGGNIDFTDVPFYYEVSGPKELNILTTIVIILRAKLVESTDDLRKKMHLSAVMVNNFGNQLLVMAETIVGRTHALRLFPILTEQLHNWQTTDAQNLQTGPAIRKDEVTLNKQMTFLKDHPKWLTLYKLMTELIQKQDEL